MNNTFILLSAGKSRDLSEYGPTSLLRYKNRSLIRRQISVINDFCENPRIILVTGFESQKVTKHKLKCEYVNNYYYEKNQSFSISLALNRVQNSNIWIINGDLVFSKSCLKIPDYSSPYVFVDYGQKIGDTKIGVNHSDGKLVIMDYGLPQKWTQIFYLPAVYQEVFNKYCKEDIFLYEIINKFNEEIEVSVGTNKKSSIIEIDSKEYLNENFNKSG